jgi:hypothetical protein
MKNNRLIGGLAILLALVAVIALTSTLITKPPAEATVAQQHDVGLCRYFTETITVSDKTWNSTRGVSQNYVLVDQNGSNHRLENKADWDKARVGRAYLLEKADCWLIVLNRYTLKVSPVR